MIRKTVTKRRIQQPSSQQDLAYWLSKTPEERVAAVDYLRQQYYGSTARLQKVARVVEEAVAGRTAGRYGDIPVYYIGREQFIANKRATGRQRDLADLEALAEA